MLQDPMTMALHLQKRSVSRAVEIGILKSTNDQTIIN